jgi:cytochrome P450
MSSPFADPPKHTHWRKLISRGFTARQIERMRVRIHEVADDLADDLAVKGPPAEIMDAFAFPLSVTVICEILGIPTIDRNQFHQWVDTMVSINGHRAEDKLAAYVAMADYARELTANKREHRGDDLFSELVAVHAADSARFTEDELVVTIMALLIGGYETTAHQLAKGLLALFRHPDQLAALCADLTLVPSAVEEILRYTPIDSGIGQPRFATEDIDVDGIPIAKGSTVLIVRQSVNHDESRFEDPHRFDIRRESAGQHMTFGFGPRFCIGAALARMELRAGITALLSRFPNIRPSVPLDEIHTGQRVMASGPDAVSVTW